MGVARFWIWATGERGFEGRAYGVGWYMGRVINFVPNEGELLGKCLAAGRSADQAYGNWILAVAHTNRVTVSIGYR